MYENEKYKMNSLNNTNASINFVVDSLNKTHFELIKELNKQQKEKDNIIPERSKKYIKSEFHPKKAHNKLESFILNSKKDYSKYNKVPHKSNITIDINTGVLYQTRGSDTNSFNYYKTKPYKSFISESGDSSSTNTIKNSYSFKKSVKNNENKFIMNKNLKNNLYNNNSSYKKNPKIKIQINEKKFNSFKKVPNNCKAKIKENNTDEIIENYFLLNNNIKDSNYNYNLNDNTHLLYVIDDEQENIYQNINNPKKHSDKNDYDIILNNRNINNGNIGNIDIISFELLKLNERKWIDELDELSDILIENRENYEDSIYIKYIHKLMKIHEHFNWLVNSIARYFNIIIFENEINNPHLNINNIDLPRFENIWFKGFKWKGLFIRVVPQDKSKFIIREIKALNYFMLDYLQIIDKYKDFQNNKNPLSNYIIFPLISYSEVNGFILYASSIINYEHNLDHQQSLNITLDEVIRENKGHLRLYTNINNLSYYISVNKNKNYSKINNINDSNLQSFLNLMEKFYNVKDLLCSKLFSNLNKYHFLRLQKEKYLIFNVTEFIPKLFEIKMGSIINLHFFSFVNNARKYYSMKYDILSKKINEGDKNEKNANGNNKLNPIDIIQNIYKMNLKSSFKKKDIFIYGIHFRILYEAQHINNKNYKTKNFVDYLFNHDNYNVSNKNNFNNSKYESYVVEPYVILYDLLEPLKLQYSLIKHKINSKTQDKNNKNIPYMYCTQNNYISFFLSWCKMINNNNLNIKDNFSLKQSMKKYGIDNTLKFFALFILKNNEIIDIIKISLLVNMIKLILNKKDNEKIIEKIKTDNRSTHSNNYSKLKGSINPNSFKDIRIIRILYVMQSILYPNEIFSVSKIFLEFIYQQLAFYMNILFIKYKLIDDYLSFGLFKTNNNTNKIQDAYEKFKEYNLPKKFLKDIINTARKKPFLFIKELEHKLKFILNPYILFKSSISIESMYKKLNIKQISLNFNNITHSYIQSDEISGFLLAKTIYNFESFENKINNQNFANKSIKFGEYDKDGNIYTLQSNNININYINANNESPNSTYESRKNNNLDYNNISFITSKINVSDSLGNSLSASKDKNMIINKNNNSSPICEILGDFIIQLPPVCYKMLYNYENLEESSLLINKYKNSKEYQLYKNIKTYYKISDRKVIEKWNELNENIFNNIISCNGNVQHTLIKSYIYKLIFIFFVEKSIDESKAILEKIKIIFKNGVGHLLSLNDLALINLFEGLCIEKDNELTEAEKESFYSKSLMLLLMSYGDPRGRNNDSHEILLFPIWKLLYKLHEIDKDLVIFDYFNEMFLSLDYLEKSKNNLNNYNENKINFVDSLMNIDNNSCSEYEKDLNKSKVNNISSFKPKNFLMDSLNVDSFNTNNNHFNKKSEKQIENNNSYNNIINKNYFLSQYIFNDYSIINKLSFKYYSYPLIDFFETYDMNAINNFEKQFYSKEFILYFLKIVQNLLTSNNQIIFGEKYISEFISNDLLNNNNNISLNLDDKKEEFSIKQNNIPHQLKKSKSQKGAIIAKTEIKEKKDKQLKFKNNSEKCLKRTNSCKHNIFSHFLYLELLQKLSYKSNAPSGVIISFGNNSHNETGLDKTDKVTSPHIIYKLKNEIVNHIYAGWEYNIIITNEGEIFSFGHNQYYQCGLPNINKSIESIKDPKNISKLNNNIKAISASCGNEHTLILSQEHTVYSFGNNEDGILGINNNLDDNKSINNKNDLREYKFNKVDFGEYTNKIIEISSGTMHNLALTYDGKVFSWGSSQGGQLGLSIEELEKVPGFKNNFYISSPINIPIINKKKAKDNINENYEENIIKISCGEAHSLALTDEGKVYSWGFGSNGQLGLGFCEDSFEPGEGLKNSMRYTPEKLEEINDENVVEIKCGKTFSMFINNRGDLYACGVNDLNQLGIQEMPSKEFLYNKNEEMCYDFVFPTKVDYFLNMKVESIACGEGHCLATIKDNLSNTQTIWSWGNNKFGQLGQGTIIKKCLPRPINCLFEYNSYRFDEVACGGFHSLCLIKHNESINWIYDDYEKIICMLIDEIGII